MNWLLPSNYLLAARQAIIIWTTLAVWPIEIVFDSIEDELLARGHHLRSDM